LERAADGGERNLTLREIFMRKGDIETTILEFFEVIAFKH
jgi:hypothetical protein